MNAVTQTIPKRVSLRKYADRPIAPEHLDLILESAIRAPTAGNMMFYSIVLKDPATKQTLSEICDHQPFIGGSLSFGNAAGGWVGFQQPVGCELR